MSVLEREAWSKGKGRYTFNTGGYCPIELSCLCQSCYLKSGFPALDTIYGVCHGFCVCFLLHSNLVSSRSCLILLGRINTTTPGGVCLSKRGTLWSFLLLSDGSHDDSVLPPERKSGLITCQEVKASRCRMEIHTLWTLTTRSIGPIGKQFTPDSF